MSHTSPRLVIVFSAYAALALATTGCSKKAETPPVPAKTDAAPSPTPPPVADANKPALGDFKEMTGFSTPESVLVVPDQAYYLVSNINGGPLDIDGNGFISKLGYDSTVQALKWIDGTSQKIELNAPKGMAIRGAKLYVADINVVRSFDLATGEAAGDITIPGASFLNDLTVEGDNLYVSDTGIDATFKPTGTGAVYRIGVDNKVTKEFAGGGTDAPNGVLATNGQLWVASFSTAELYRIADGKKTDVQLMTTGGLDGLVALGDGRLAVSSWEGKAIYAGKPGEPFTTLIADVASPADFTVDVLKQRLIVPLFQSNAVRFYEYQ